MKRHPVIYILLLLAVFLSACGGSLPLNIEFSSVSRTPRPTALPIHTITPAFSPTLDQPPAPTATITPIPTRKSPYPVSQGTPLPDPGFVKIGSGNADRLGKVFQNTTSLRQAALISPNKERVMLATSEGLALFAIDGTRIATWPEIKMAQIACPSCLTINEDASRFAVVLRNEGRWQIQVYDIVENKLVALKTFSEKETFGLAPNPAQVALSPDGELLAYSFGGKTYTIYDLPNEKIFFEYSGKVESLHFSRGGQYVAARRGQELLIWDIYSLESGFRNLLLPSPDTAIDFSDGGEFVAIAFGSTIRFYQITPLRLSYEFNLPRSYAANRTWQISFLDDETLRGYALEWDAATGTGRAVLADWTVGNDEPSNFQEVESDSPNTFDNFWNLQLTQKQLTGGLDPNSYRALRFLNTDLLVVNSQYAICSFRLSTGETTCQTENDIPLFASDGPIFREVREDKKTVLVNPAGEPLFSLAPYPIHWINHSAEFLLLNVDDRTTDLYIRAKDLPVQSVPGVFRAAAENNKLLVFLTRENPELQYLTMVEKASQKMLFQKKESRLYDLLGMALDGTTYFLRQDRDKQQAILKAIPPGTDEVTDLLRIDLRAEPLSMAVSPQNLLAVGMQDGSITIVSLDSLTQKTIQALQGPVSALAFSPDNRYLAVAGQEGITVFAVRP